MNFTSTSTVQGRFQVGLYSGISNTKTLHARDKLEEAAGEGPPLFPNKQLILCRAQAQLVATHGSDGRRIHHIVKPLQHYVKRKEQTLLIDDNQTKVLGCGDLSLRFSCKKMLHVDVFKTSSCFFFGSISM